jgi:hypothetical protein
MPNDEIFSNTLRGIAAARTADSVSGIRISIADAVEGATIDRAAGAALEAVARVAADRIAARGEQPPKASTAPAGGEVRHPATITAAVDCNYEDSGGEQIRGTVALADGDTIRFSLRRSWGGSVRAIYGAAGVADDQPAEALAGKGVEVVLGEFMGRDSNPRPCIKKWFRPAGTTSGSTPVEKAPAWQADEPAPRAPRRTPAQRAHANFKANLAASAEGDDEIPF